MGKLLVLPQKVNIFKKNYDYGCQKNESNFYVYRINYINENGIKIELLQSEIDLFCKKYNLKMFINFFNGKALDLFPEIKTDDLIQWQENFLVKLEEKFNEKKCFMCKNNVPEEGIVIRIERNDRFKAFKLKSKKFLILESNQE